MSAFRNLIAVAMFNVWVYFAVSNLLLFQSGISEPEFSRLLPIFGGFLFQFGRIWSRIKSLGFRKFGLGKKVSVSVSENLVSEKSFGFGKFGLEKKVSVLVSEKLVSEKKNQNNIININKNKKN